MKKEVKSNPYNDYEPIISDSKKRLYIFKQYQKPTLRTLIKHSNMENLILLVNGVGLLLMITVLVIGHMIKGYDWKPLALLYIPLIPFVLTLVKQLDEK